MVQQEYDLYHIEIIFIGFHLQLYLANFSYTF
jgi:hypothetical protein